MTSYTVNFPAVGKRRSGRGPRTRRQAIALRERLRREAQHAKAKQRLR